MSRETISDILGQVSNSFCPLRWTYMQVDLQHGKVKACCKTPFQRIEEAQIERLGSITIFNSEYLQERRREMLAGVRHSDCNTCWIQEDLGLLSYRYSQSANEPFRSSIPVLQAQRRLDDAVPKHIEIILNTNCDLKCCYCGPEFSSAWAVEIRNQGPYPQPHDDPQNAPASPLFPKAFWQWFDDNRHSIEYVQFNGGEPLIQSEFYASLERILNFTGTRELRIGVISNLNTPPNKMEKLHRILPLLLERHSFRLGISQDSVNERAEYIRNGLNWSRFDENLRGLLKNFSGLDIQMAPTMSALNVTSIKDLMVYADQVSEILGTEIIMRPSIVMWPAFQSPLILPSEYSPYLEEAIVFLERAGRWPVVRERLQEIIASLGQIENVEQQRRIFHKWFVEYDKRRKLSFLEVFPEMESFWRHCAAL
jgi:sulfatase maturation enzyme AslB (radical SAM superfamily)